MRPATAGDARPRFPAVAFFPGPLRSFAARPRGCGACCGTSGRRAPNPALGAHPGTTPHSAEPAPPLAALLLLGVSPGYAVVVVPCQEHRRLTQNGKLFLRGPLAPVRGADRSHPVQRSAPARGHAAAGRRREQRVAFGARAAAADRLLRRPWRSELGRARPPLAARLRDGAPPGCVEVIPIILAPDPLALDRGPGPPRIDYYYTTAREDALHRNPHFAASIPGLPRPSLRVRAAQ